MSDAAAIGQHAEKVREAAYELAEALKVACDGHRGWALSRLEIEEVVNDYLKDAGVPFRLRVTS